MAGYSKDAIVEMNMDSLAVRVASRLFAVTREWNDSMVEAVRLVTLYQRRVALNIFEETI